MLCALALAGVAGCVFWRKPPLDRPALVNPALDDRLAWLLSFDVPLIGADSLARAGDVLTFDVRTPEEFAVSHIAGAVRVDPDGELPGWLDTVARDRPIALYCSVGYRSERLGRRLRGRGFTQVSNVYGSLFDWVARGYGLVDTAGRPTRRLHVYNRRWGELVTAPDVEEVW